MKLLTTTIYEQLLRNGRIRQALEDKPVPPKAGSRAQADFLPVVKLFAPGADCTWLLVELDPDDPDIAFGLCDLGMGFPDLGSVRISELEAVRGRFSLPVERDRYFVAWHTISVYARAAWNEAAITENPELPRQAVPSDDGRCGMTCLESGQFGFDDLLRSVDLDNRARKIASETAHLPGTMDEALPSAVSQITDDHRFIITRSQRQIACRGDIYTAPMS